MLRSSISRLLVLHQSIAVLSPCGQILDAVVVATCCIYSNENLHRCTTRLSEVVTPYFNHENGRFQMYGGILRSCGLSIDIKANR